MLDLKHEHALPTNLDPSLLMPPASPENERAASVDPQFAAARRAEMEAIVKGRVVWGSQLFTHSEKWGPIWRADFTEPDRPSLIHPARVVCWTTADGVPSTAVMGGENKTLVLDS